MARGRPARREETIDGARIDFREPGRIPARPVVLVHQHRADALEAIALLEARVHEAELHAEAIAERERLAAAQLLERDHEHRRGAAAKEPQRLARPGAELGTILGFQRS